MRYNSGTAWCCTVLSVFAIIILSTIAMLFRSGYVPYHTALDRPVRLFSYATPAVVAPPGYWSWRCWESGYAGAYGAQRVRRAWTWSTATESLWELRTMRELGGHMLWSCACFCSTLLCSIPQLYVLLRSSLLSSLPLHPLQFLSSLQHSLLPPIHSLTRCYVDPSAVLYSVDPAGRESTYNFQQAFLRVY
jgi:hypothetical protein